jgi:O-acetyl-ADP-ribose deacetylase (regulator of RNase III)
LQDEVQINGRTIELKMGDISRQSVDAIVNAANSRLAGGGGVDGAIHRAGGPSIMAETDERYPEGCPMGSAVISGAGNLTSKYVIHAVGPFWNGGDRGEAESLGRAYESALALADAHDCGSIALPALSTGAYRYPIDEAAAVALRTTATFLRGLAEDRPLQIVRFVLFSDAAVSAFRDALAKIQGTPSS